MDFPECIEELTPGQYVYYIYLSSWLAGGNIDLNYWCRRWFSYLAGLGSSNFTMLKAEYIAEAEALLETVTGSFLVDSDRGKTPTFRTCLNLLKEYKGYRGPGDWLNGLSWGKFVECTTLMEQTGGDAADQEEVYKTIARAMYSIPEGEEIPAVLVWHAPVLLGNVWAQIQAGPIDINGRLIDFSIIFKSTGEKKPDDKTGWTGISFEVAAAGIFGNINELDAADFWAVLIYLYKCKFEYIHDKTNKS